MTSGLPGPITCGPRFGDFRRERFRDFISAYSKFRVSLEARDAAGASMDASTRAGSECGNTHTVHGRDGHFIKACFRIKAKNTFLPKIFFFI